MAISRRKVVALLLIAVLCFGGSSLASGAAGPKSVQFVVGQSVYVVDGIVKIMDAVPFLRDNRTFVPVRYLAMALGIPESGITWDEETRTVTLATGRVTLKMVIGEKVMFVDGKPLVMDVAPLIQDGRTYLPARYVAEALGYEVGWNAATQTVVVSAAGEPEGAERELTELAARLQDQIVMVRVFDGAGTQVAFGSGVAVGRDLVLTNLHVVRGGVRATVVAGPDREWPVEGLAGWDEANDLALLKVNGGFTPVELGDSDSLRVGQRVIAVGNPLGLRATVSDGIVSGLRDINGRKLIQTTAPISPGSSGGGLFDLEGRLVGITTACVEGGQNLNLAVPVNAAKYLLANPGPAVPLSLVAGEGGIQREEPNRVTAAQVAAFLNLQYSRFRTSKGLLQFFWMEWDSPPGYYDVEVWGEIDPDTYLNWLLIDASERMDVMRQVAEALGELCGGQTFNVILFYQDYWTFYPSWFAPDEVTLSVDGRSWLVTHVIGWAYGDAEKIRWFAQP